MATYLSGSMCLLLLCHFKLSAQTTIAAGNVSGTWTKKGSPYLVKGDINIPSGKTLVIQPGVKVKFKGSYNINVQGSITAVGTVNDSILFTVFDTNGFTNNYKVGWNGIHFDPRPIIWDTIRFKMPKIKETKQAVTEQIKSGLIDTTTKIILALQGQDLVNDKSTELFGKDTKQASRLSFCRFEYSSTNGRMRPYIFGGAIYIYRYSNLVISNSVFENNRTYAGGAIYCKEAAPVIIDNVVRKCRAISSGGAMVFIHSGAILLRNNITANTSGYNGGGILFYESCPYVLNNTILSNTAVNSGGGIYIERMTEQIINTGDYKVNENTKVSQDLTSANIKFSKDIIKNTGSSNGRFLNNLICDNTAKYGGGAGLYATAPEFTNNTICNNKAASNGGGFYCFYSAPSIVNSIIYGNQSLEEGQQLYLIGKNILTISYSDLESGVSGISKDSTCNLSFDYQNLQDSPPLFVNPDKSDYALQAGSPCIDAGKTDTTSLRLVSLDLKEKNRINNFIIDVGAIEYAGKESSNLKSTQADNEINIENESSKETVYNLYPNPSSGKFSIIIYNNQNSSLWVSVFSPTGQRVYYQSFITENFVEEIIDLEGNPSGIYEVQVSSDKRVIYHDRIIIE
jgi:predicted outer membrane repeat protein